LEERRRFNVFLNIAQRDWASLSSSTQIVDMLASSNVSRLTGLIGSDCPTVRVKTEARSNWRCFCSSSAPGSRWCCRLHSVTNPLRQIRIRWAERDALQNAELGSPCHAVLEERDNSLDESYALTINLPCSVAHPFVVRFSRPIRSTAAANSVAH
jgi:hypothetical protein